jgi:hypothetical protein
VVLGALNNIQFVRFMVCLCSWRVNTSIAGIMMPAGLRETFAQFLTGLSSVNSRLLLVHAFPERLRRLAVDRDQRLDRAQDFGVALGLEVAAEFI